MFWGSFQGAKRMRRKVNRSRVFSTEVKNEWSYISIPPICLCLYVVSNARFILLLPFLLVKVKVKVAFWSFFNTEAILDYCILAPNKFLHSSLEAPRIIQMRETSTSEGGNYCQILLANSNLRKSARIFYIPQSWDMGQILLLPLRRKAY